MSNKVSEQFEVSAEAAPLNGWSEEEKIWLRTIGMTEDKPADPAEFERYLRREYKAAMRYYKRQIDELPPLGPDECEIGQP